MGRHILHGQRSIQANSHAGAQRHAFVRTAQKRCRLVPHFEYADEDLAPFVAAGRDRGRWKRRRIAPKANTLWPKLIVQNLGTIHRYGSATYGSAKCPQDCLRQLRISAARVSSQRLAGLRSNALNKLSLQLCPSCFGKELDGWSATRAFEFRVEFFHFRSCKIIVLHFITYVPEPGPGMCASEEQE